jgi:hypothetical protein
LDEWGTHELQSGPELKNSLLISLFSTKASARHQHASGQGHVSEPQRGIEAYERFKADKAMPMDFFSTPVSRAIVPRALKNGENVLTGKLVKGRRYP